MSLIRTGIARIATTLGNIVACLMPLSQPRSWIARRADIDAKAQALIAEHNGSAYYVARDLARKARRTDSTEADTWAKVARRLAVLTNHEVGVSGADRRSSP